MKTSKYFLFAAAFVLLTTLSLGAMAQGRRDPTGSIVKLPPPEPIGTSVSVNAIEITDGILGTEDATKKETAFGYSFLGRTTGSLPGSFTLSMNCTPAIPIPGETSELTGGIWTLPVYAPAIEGGGYAGSLYGTVAKGEMLWDMSATGANVYFVLNVDGGTQSWNGVSGYATFAGTIFVDEKTQKTTLSGNLVFNIMVLPIGIDSK
jgi:hypothetical protein